MTLGPRAFEGECAGLVGVCAGGPLHHERGRVRFAGAELVLVLVANARGVAHAVEQADLEEGEARLVRSELVLKLDEERGQEAAVHEKLRIVHQDRVGSESEGSEHLERIVSALGPGRGLGRVSHVWKPGVEGSQPSMKA